MTEDEVKKSRMKKGVPGYKARRFLNNMFGGDSKPEKEEVKKPKKKKSRFNLIEKMFKTDK